MHVHWKHEQAGHVIYSLIKDLKIVERLLGLQKMMAIHYIFHLLPTTYHDEPTHIFTDYLNVLYMLNTQIKHPTIHNNHPNKIILESTHMITTLPHRNHHTPQVRGHANIDGNEQAGAVAK